MSSVFNRGESYHQLRRAVSYANFGKLRFRSEDDQHIWSECSRLITNCTIYDNATILSGILAHKEGVGDTAGAESLKQVSPVTWQPNGTLGSLRNNFPFSPQSPFIGR